MSERDGGAVIDPESIATLRGLGDHVLAEMVDLYLEDAPPRLAELDAAVGRGDATAVADLAHALKGSSANFGSGPMVAACRELEVAARSGDLDGAADRVARITGELARLRAALEAELGR